MGERRGTKALELWCRRMTEGYPGVKIENMTTSWRDGLAFCAMIHHFRPDLIEFEKLNKDDVYYNNDLAFSTAERHLGIPALLDADDMASYEVPDRLSILTYLSQFYQVFASPDSHNRLSNKRPSAVVEKAAIAKPTGPPPKMAHIVGVPKRDPCQICELPVFLAERLMVGKYVYHRTCLRCARCKSQLTPGNFYETEIDGEYCCETCPDEEKKREVANSSKDRGEESKSIACHLAFFEKEGSKVLQKSLSDEEKSQSLKNQLQYTYKPDSARSNFLNNPSSDECDSHNSSRRNSDSSSDTTSSDKTNDDLSKEPPELPKSLPPLLSEDEPHRSSSFHIQENTMSTIEHDDKTIPKISHLQDIQVETIIWDMLSVGHVPSITDAQKSESVDSQNSESIEAQKRKSIDTHNIESIGAHKSEHIDAHKNESIDAHKNESIDAHKSVSKIKNLEIEDNIFGAIHTDDTKVPDMERIQIKTYFYDDKFSSRWASIRPLEPAQTHSKAGTCEVQLICGEKSNDTMDLESQHRFNSDTNIESKDEAESLERISISEEKNAICIEVPQIIELPKIRNMKFENDTFLEEKKRGIFFAVKNDSETLSQEPPRGTENPELLTESHDEQQDNDVEFCNDHINLNKHSVNVTKDNSENDGEMGIIDTYECIKELPTIDAKQPIVNSESLKSMVRTRLHQFEDIANKSQNSSISNLRKDRLSHSTDSSRTCNVEGSQSCEMELRTINLQTGNESPAAVSSSNEVEEHASCTLNEKILENQFYLSEDKSDNPDNSEKLEKSDTPDQLDKPEKSEKLEKSDTLDKSDKPDKSDKLEKLELDTSDKSDKPDISEKIEKSDTPDKSDKPDISDKLEKLDKLDKPDNLAKSEKSDTSDKLTFKIEAQKKKINDYPEELNPFKSDEEEDNQSSQRKTNPFESSDEEEKKNKVTHSNPFGSESEDDNVSSRFGKLPVPTPRITKSSMRVSPVTQVLMWGTCEKVLHNTQDCCRAVPLDHYQNVKPSEKPTYCSCPQGGIKNRKKKPAPQPPKVSKEIFSSINQDSKKSSPGSSTASTPTTTRKKRPAPSPPGHSKADGCLRGKSELCLSSMETASTAQEEVIVEKPQAQLEKLCDEEKALLEGNTNISSNESTSTTLDQENESTKTSKRRLIALDASLVEDANSSEDLKLKEEDNVVYRRTLVPPVLDDSTLSPSSDTSESHDRQLEKMKDNKEAKNRNRQSQVSLPSEENDPLYNKSVHGKWKRRKGPAPALPIPPKKVLQMLPLQEIRHELEIIEVQQQGLEKQGVMLEKMIRERCEGPTGEDNIEGSSNPPNSKEVEDLILQLFELVNEKNELFRRQAELMYLRRQHRLEQEQADLEYEIRVLMAQPERNKTDSDKAREEALIARLVEVVQLRNEVIECLEMDRLREAEEDLSIKQRLEMHSAKRDEELSKQTPTKLSKKEKKKQKEHKKIGKSKKLDADKDADESELNAEKQKAKKKKKKFLF